MRIAAPAASTSPIVVGPLIHEMTVFSAASQTDTAECEGGEGRPRIGYGFRDIARYELKEMDDTV